MVESIRFKNFKILRDAELPLGRFTLIVGPNGSGKSTALQALQVLNQTSQPNFERFVTAGLATTDTTTVKIVLQWSEFYERTVTTALWHHKDNYVSPLQHHRPALDRESPDAIVMPNNFHMI